MTHDAAGWQPDPTGRHDHRYWDGSGWTEHVADAGVASTDPYEPGPAAMPGPDEPTAVTAVAEGDTASYPTAGAPPYVPPSPVAGTGASPRGRRGLLIGAGVLAIVILAVVAFLALGDDDPAEPVAERSTDTTEPRDGSTDGAGDGFGGGDLPEDGFDDLPEDFADGNMEDAIAEAYEEAFDLSEEKAQCLAERITEAFAEDGLDPEQAMGEVFGYLSDCDISMEELGAG